MPKKKLSIYKCTTRVEDCQRPAELFFMSPVDGQVFARCGHHSIGWPVSKLSFADGTRQISVEEYAVMCVQTA
jgi:hypothetical protein